MIRNAKDLHAPFSRSRSDDVEGVLIVQLPGQGLRRVRDTHHKIRYAVEALTESGWKTFLELTEIEATSPVEALQIWLNIEDSLAPDAPELD